MSDNQAMNQFFAGQVCLIVEPSKSFLASIQACVKSLNIESLEIVVVSKYEEAKKIIQEKKPKLLITEYDVEGYNGLSLVEMQQAIYSDDARICVVVSKNSNDSVVAEAAEEQVDSFLLKPFSPDDFQKKLKRVIDVKVSPSAYTLKIREGRELILAKEFEQAIVVLKEAKTLNDKPSLACFYLGDSFRNVNEKQKALKEFEEGRSYQPFHYKCLIGQFEILVENKDYPAAFALIPILMQNFPLTPRRLTQFFIASVFSHHFDFLPACYLHLLKLDKRSAELTQVATAAFFTGGKWFLQNDEVSKAIDLFEKGMVVMAKDIVYLGKVAHELIKTKHPQEAVRFLEHAQPADVGTPDYNRLAFMVERYTMSPVEYLEKSRKFGLSGDADLESYRLLVKLFAENNNSTFAEAMISKAVASYPEARNELYQILEENLKK